MNKRTPTLPDYLLLTGLAVIFGSSFMFTGLSVREIPPLTVAAARLSIAALITYPIMRAMGQRLPSGSVWFYIFLSGLLGNALPFALISWGQITVDAGLAAIFMAIMPLATILLAQFFTADEKINRWKIMGVILGFIGIVVLMGKESLASVGDQTIRQFAILCAALCYAANAIVTRQFAALPRYSTVAALMIASSVLILPLSLFFDQPWNLSAQAASIMSILTLAIGPTAIATLLILVIIDRCGATFLSQINFMVPLFGVLFATLFLNERLSANAYIALAIIIAALALSRHGQKRT